MSRRPRGLFLAAATAALVMAMATPHANALAGAPTSATVAACPGATLPAGYVVDHAVPHLTHVPYSPAWLYNPQSISGFTILSSSYFGDSAAQRQCLVRLGVTALLAGGRTQSGTGFDGQPATALLFGYPFPFSANPSTPTLQPGWVSALGQGSALRALLVAWQATKDPTYLAYGQQVLNSFAIPPAQGGFVTQENGRTWLQEYPSTPPSYVLNGNQETLLALQAWVSATGDPNAAHLVADVVATEKSLLPLYEVPMPQGILESYDLLRGRPAAPLRVLTSHGITLQAVTVGDQDGTGTSALYLPVARRDQEGPNLLANPTLAVWSHDHPTGWPTPPGDAPPWHGRDGGGPFLGLTVTNPSRLPAVEQLVPAARVTPGATYRLSFSARTAIPAGKAGTSGAWTIDAVCGTRVERLNAQATIRGYNWSTFDVTVTAPAARCGLLVVLYPLRPTIGTSVLLRGITLAQVPPRPATGVPTLGLQVLADPHPLVSVTYTGSGVLQAWRRGRWVTLRSLWTTVRPVTLTAEIPPWAQGRNVNQDYDEIHVSELYFLGTQLPDLDLMARAKRWAPLAPTRHNLTFTR